MNQPATLPGQFASLKFGDGDEFASTKHDPFQTNVHVTYALTDLLSSNTAINSSQYPFRKMAQIFDTSDDPIQLYRTIPRLH